MRTRGRWWGSRLSVLVAAVAVLVALVAGSPATDGRTLGALRQVHHSLTTLLSAQTALIMNGTFEPVVTPNWIEQVMADFVTPVLGPGFSGDAMDTPQQFWPLTGLRSRTFDTSIRDGYGLLDARVQQHLTASADLPLAVFGYSQSAIIASVQKRTLSQQYAGAEVVPPVSFITIGNPYRPNGGILARLPLLAGLLTPWTRMTSTPTDTPFPTVDIVHQYDLWADFPTYPLNLLADINAVFGLFSHWYVPDSVNPALRDLIPTVSLDPASPQYHPATQIQVYGDTSYAMIPAKHLPMLLPLHWIGLGRLADVVEPVLRLLVELGYDRSAPYGQVVRAGLFPRIDPRDFIADLGEALGQSWDAVGELFGPRAPMPAVDAVATARTADLAGARQASVPRPAQAARASIRARPARPGPALSAAENSGPAPAGSIAVELQTDGDLIPAAERQRPRRVVEPGHRVALGRQLVAAQDRE